MRLTLQELTELLQLSEKTIRRWIKKGDIPAYRIQGQYRFNKAEILEWATAHRVHMATDIFKEHQGVSVAGLGDALARGGIFYGLRGSDKEAALKAVVENIPLPAAADRDMLLQFILAREAAASTGVGEGIAIPHVRNPLVLDVEQPLVTLCFLERPVDFLSLDNEPVFCLFTIVAPTVRTHLYLLSRLAFALRDPGFKDAVKSQAPREEIMAQCRNVEFRLPVETGGRG